MRRRILTLGVGMTALVIVAFAVPLALLIRENLESKALDEARLSAQAIAQFITVSDPDGDQVASYLEGADAQFVGVSWVEFPDGHVVGNPPADWESAELEGHSTGSDPQVEDWDDGVVTSVEAMTVDGPSTVYSFISEHELREGLFARLLILGAVSVGLLLVSVAGSEVLARRLARPLEETAAAAERLAAGDTAARAPEDGPPEVAEVGAALNGLADRIDEVIAVEREAVADLSHRLRTPLTALRLDVDALADRETAARLGGHVSSLERTLTAIIHAARRPQREGRLPQSDAAALVRDRVAFWSPLVEDQRRRLVMSVPDGEHTVRASAEDLGAAVDALIENVIAHTPEGTELDVTLFEGVAGGDGQVTIAVGDSGPGIPTDAGQRGRSDRGSSGLGLDIARRCAEASGGSLLIRGREPGGAVVELHLGRP